MEVVVAVVAVDLSTRGKGRIIEEGAVKAWEGVAAAKDSATRAALVVEYFIIIL